MKYLRFPVWIFNLVEPQLSYQEFKKYIADINSVSNRSNFERTQFMGQISRHDQNGIRRNLIDLFNKIDKVNCAGVFPNNTDELQAKFNDDKKNYLRHFKFNLCSENTSVNQYVTEKIFDAIAAGCIPIYWGAGDNLVEPDILNQEAFFRYTGSNEAELLSQIQDLYYSDCLYQEFIQIPPFKDGAAEIIWDKLQHFQNRLVELAG